MDNKVFVFFLFSFSFVLIFFFLYFVGLTLSGTLSDGMALTHCGLMMPYGT